MQPFKSVLQAGGGSQGKLTDSGLQNRRGARHVDEPATQDSHSKIESSAHRAHLPGRAVITYLHRAAFFAPVAGGKAEARSQALFALWYSVNVFIAGGGGGGAGGVDRVNRDTVWAPGRAGVFQTTHGMDLHMRPTRRGANLSLSTGIAPRGPSGSDRIRG